MCVKGVRAGSRLESARRIDPRSVSNFLPQPRPKMLNFLVSGDLVAGIVFLEPRSMKNVNFVFFGPFLFRKLGWMYKLMKLVQHSLSLYKHEVQVNPYFNHLEL